MMVSDALVDLVSGSAGGVANVVVGQPMDTVKVCFAMYHAPWCHVSMYHATWCHVSCNS